MKYFLIVWFILGAPWVFPYMVLFERQRTSEQVIRKWVYGAIALVVFFVYVALVIGLIWRLF